MPDRSPPHDAAGVVDSEYEWHPVYLHTRREAFVVLLIWLGMFCWTVPYCYLHGYPGEGFTPDQLETVWGIPSWVFWGIIAPWAVANLITVWFCFVYMADDDLGEANEEADLSDDSPAERGGNVR